MIKKKKLSEFDERLCLALQDYEKNSVKIEYKEEELDYLIKLGLSDLELFVSNDDLIKEEYDRIKQVVSYDEDKNYIVRQIVKLLLVMNVLIRDEFKYFANVLFEENHTKIYGEEIKTSLNAFHKIFSSDMKEKYDGNIDLAVFNALSSIKEIHEKVKFSKLQNIGYMDVEKEIRRIGTVIEEHQDMYGLYTDLKFMLEVFTRTEILRETEFNAKNRKSDSEWLHIDSTNSDGFDAIMKRILMLQALLGLKIKPQFKPIVDGIFEGCKDIVTEAMVDDISILSSPIDFYNKGVQKCIMKN